MRLLRSRTKSLSLSPPDCEEEEVEIWVDKVIACSAAFLVTKISRWEGGVAGKVGFLLLLPVTSDWSLVTGH